MDERQALVRAICEDPEDDTRRLAFADWLDEHARDAACSVCRGDGRLLAALGGGNPWRGRKWMECERCRGTGVTSDDREWAAYIRRGVALCRPETLSPGHDMGGTWSGWDGVIDTVGQYPPQDADHCPLCRAISDQRTAQGRIGRIIATDLASQMCLPADWSGRADPGRGYLAVRFRRGFVSHVSCHMPDFIKHAAAIFAAHPVTRVTLTDREPSRYDNRNRPRMFFWSRGRVSYRDGWPAHALEPELWDLLPNGSAYHTRADAHAAPSVACVAYGRGLVGLPPLKTASMPTLGSCPVG